MEPTNSLYNSLKNYVGSLDILVLAFEELANTEVTAEDAARDMASAQATHAIAKDLRELLAHHAEDET